MTLSGTLFELTFEDGPDGSARIDTGYFGDVTLEGVSAAEFLKNGQFEIHTGEGLYRKGNAHLELNAGTRKGDHLIGGEKINGGKGKDLLVAASETEAIRGGRGKDTFDVSDANVEWGLVIKDFKRGETVITEVEFSEMERNAKGDIVVTNADGATITFDGTRGLEFTDIDPDWGL